jgi:hypothetical protein
VKNAFEPFIHQARDAGMSVEFKRAVNMRLGRFFLLMGYEVEKV